MRIQRRLALLSLGIVVVSCSTFPTKQLTMDFTDETIPVMVSTTKTEDSMRKLTFDSGFSSRSMSMSSSNGSVTTTMTMNDSQTLNQPVAVQLQNTLIQTPRELVVSALEFRNSYYLLMLMGSIEKTDYSTHLEVLVPLGEKK